MRRTFARSLLASAAVLVIAACGGGGGSGSTGTTAPPAPPSNQNLSPPIAKSSLSGLAATGAPVAGAAVAVQCASGATLNGSTDANGKWSLELSNQAFPCLVTVSGGTLPAGQSLYSVAIDKDSALNVTPLTTLITAGAAGALPASLASDAAALTAASKALEASLARVNASLAAAGYDTLEGNPFVTAFKPQAGDAHDDLISSLMRSLKDEAQTLTELATAFAKSRDEVPVPHTHVFAANELTRDAMPQLNQASLSVEAGVLKMTLPAASNSVGSFVNGGYGNKAVLQLPGLAGTKLSDLKGVTMQVSGPNSVVYDGKPKNVYTYMNFTVDTDCSQPALNPATHTLQQMRDRYRVFIYDPYVNFIQRSNAISATQISTIDFTLATPGWRVSAGPILGTDIATNADYQGHETLAGFNFDKYPNACIVDGVTGDGGMYRDAACASASGLNASDPGSCGKPYRGAIVVLGDSSTVWSAEWKVKKVRVNTKSARNFVFE